MGTIESCLWLPKLSSCIRFEYPQMTCTLSEMYVHACTIWVYVDKPSQNVLFDVIRHTSVTRHLTAEAEVHDQTDERLDFVDEWTSFNGFFILRKRPSFETRIADTSERYDLVNIFTPHIRRQPHFDIKAADSIWSRKAAFMGIFCRCSIWILQPLYRLRTWSMFPSWFDFRNDPMFTLYQQPQPQRGLAPPFDELRSTHTDLSLRWHRHHRR